MSRGTTDTSFAWPTRLALAVIVGAVFVGHGAARAADAPGCVDPNGFKRFEGAHIVLCNKKDFAEYTLQTGKLKAWNYTAKKPELEASQETEGKLVQNLYLAQPGPSSAEVFRNYKTELTARGFTILYEAKALDIGADQGRLFESNGPGGQLLGYSPNAARYLAAQKDENGQRLFVSLYVIEFEGGFHGKITPAKGQVLVRLDVVTAGEIKDRLVLVTAPEIKAGLGSKGKVVIYGILFDFNKDDIKPASRPVVAEIATYLKANPAARLRIVGHTDDVGGLEFNDRLSLRRANAVVRMLVAEFGIDAARLAASGSGLRQPIATNASEDGRARNRRVELTPL